MIEAVGKNWKSSAAGLVLVMVGVMSAVLHVTIPGFTMDPGAAIAAGLGLLVAKDG